MTIPAIEEIARARSDQSTVLTIGTFDGVHRGHRFVVSQVVEYARANGLRSGVITFTTTPRETLRPNLPVGYLSDLDERVALLKEIGVDIVAPLTFDLELAALSARDFLAPLCDALSLRHLIVGPDFAMGYRRQGTISVLTELGAELGFSVSALDALRDNEERVSSSAIRRLLTEDGAVEDAGRMLGRAYTLSGPVIEGHHRGKDLGFPTANIDVPARRAVPADGVYVTRAHVGEDSLESVTNVGDNPTFDDAKRMVETFILDFDRDIYGQEIKLEFLQRLRAEETFENIDSLVAQIDQDVQDTRDYFARG